VVKGANDNATDARPGDDPENNDRLSVYGIGLKRAIFKLGNCIEMESNHRQDGFALNLLVDWWENETEIPWQIPIDPVP